MQLILPKISKLFQDDIVEYEYGNQCNAGLVNVPNGSVTNSNRLHNIQKKILKSNSLIEYFS